MRTRRILNRLWASAQAVTHGHRFSSLMVAVEGLLRGGRLSVTSLGRHLRSSTSVKHCIKRMDRLAGNRRLHADRVQLYSVIAKRLIAHRGRPVIVVDWSGIGIDGNLWLLRAAVAFEGRALTLYEEVHSKNHYDNRRVRTAFLHTLRRIVPEHVRPILVTDAGFRTTWFRQVQAIGWDWVGRVRGQSFVSFDGISWLASRSLHPRARHQPLLHSDAFLTQYRPLPCSIILWKLRAKGRMKLRRSDKQQSQWLRSKYYQAYHNEPWVLATSLHGMSADNVARIYRMRMAIEESFRDLKCHRFGWAFGLARSHHVHRVENLLLIAALASVTSWICGAIAHRLELQRSIQANSERRRQVLSNHFLGAYLLRQQNQYLDSIHKALVQPHQFALVVHQ